MNRDDIIIRNAIVHILDISVGMPVLSDQMLEAAPDLYDFIRDHIYKLASGDDLKNCEWEEESYIHQLVEEFSEEDMINFSQKAAQHLYDIMYANPAIPAGDFLVVTYQAYSEYYLAFLKLNYKETYVHYTATEEGLHANYIIKQKAALPFNSKLSEAVLINMSTSELQIVEKKYEVNGIKLNYLSEIYLQCHAKLSHRSKMSILTKAVEQVNQKYFEDDYDKQMETKSIIQNELVENGALEIPVISEKLYGEQPEIQEEFVEKLEKYHIEKEKVAPQNPTTTKKYEKQFLKTDAGIEINIPMELYNDQHNVEFITNEDGTISILIKNINHIVSK